MYEQNLFKVVEPVKINTIQEEENILEGKSSEDKKTKVFKGFAEGRSK